MFQRYRKKPDKTIIAVQLALNTEGFSYRKWGGIQTCKSGDWVVNNNGDTYTIDKESFALTYKKVSDGVFYKPVIVWAKQADTNGSVKTKEGETHYQSGDYIVYNDEEKTDGYAIERGTFETTYSLCEEE